MELSALPSFPLTQPASSVQGGAATQFSGTQAMTSHDSVRFGNTDEEEGRGRKFLNRIRDTFKFENFDFKESLRGAGRGLKSYLSFSGLATDLIINGAIAAVLTAIGVFSLGAGFVLLPLAGLTLATCATVQLAYRTIKGFIKPDSYAPKGEDAQDAD